MDSWLAQIQFERPGPLRRAVKACVFHPLANYLPAGWMRALLRFARSEMAAANWADPGGWRSMTISYNGRPTQIADKVLVGASSMAMALRNRRRLAGAWLARLIDASARQPAHVLCLGAGPGHIIIDALSQARSPARATLVDLKSDAFEYGLRLARESGLEQRIRFVVGDARDIHKLLDGPVDIVKMVGLCEYLSDDQICTIAAALAAVMPPGSPIMVNSLSAAHGTNRFFRRVFGLRMNHRSPEAMRDLLGRCGFGEFVSIPEPLGVYHVIVARRI